MEWHPRVCSDTHILTVTAWERIRKFSPVLWFSIWRTVQRKKQFIYVLLLVGQKGLRIYSTWELEVAERTLATLADMQNFSNESAVHCVRHRATNQHHLPWEKQRHVSRDLCGGQGRHNCPAYGTKWHAVVESTTRLLRDRITEHHPWMR